MTALEHLHGYLRGLTWRLRFFAASRGLALTAACALLLTLLFVYIGNRFEFAGNIVLPLRIVLYAAVAAVVSLAVLLPLLRLNRRQVTREVEDRAPEFKERLLTIAERERAGENAAWMELLAEDTLAIARNNAPERIRSNRTLYGSAAAFAAAAAVLIWMIAAGPGYWGYGAALLWTGQADAAKRPLYSIDVQPGDKTIRRRSDQAVTAQLLGFSARDVVLHARYGKASKWDATPMEAANGGNSYRFVFAGVNEPVEYYVEAAHSESKHFRLNVKDLPGVKRIRIALNYPSELGLQNVTLDPAGDIRAVVGTNAEVHVQTDKPLEHGVLVLDNGSKIPLTPESGNWLSAQLPVRNDGSYYVAAIDGGETIRISEDYFIEAQKDEPPTVKISRPGTDPHVSPIEELPVTVTAADDFGVGALELHYAVNGGPEKTYSLLKTKGAKDTEAKTSIAFEDLKAVPGDMVSLYAVAHDAHATARSEIIFAQADGFDYKFSQSQQSGGMSGGGGGGNEPGDISKRQKQIIAATFNQLKGGKPGAAQAEDGKFLSEEQAKLGEQATTLARRMESRELGSSGKQFEEFAKFLNQAAADMGDAVKQLKPAKWNDALSPEQKALTSLLHAEALFRDIQISMQQGGGGNGSGNAGRDLARMFDLELDTSKNQYETGKSAPPPGEADNQKELDKARERLEALARRQQELAAQNMKSQAFEQRWQEEQLRREAEELKKQLQQLAQNSQNGSEQQQGQQGQQSGQQGQQNQEGQQPGQQGQQGQQMAQAGSAQSGSSQSGSQQSGQQRMGSNQGASSQSGSNQMGGQQSGSQQSGSQNTASARNGGREQNGQTQASAADTRQAVQQAMRALDRAEEEMRNSVSNHDKSASARAAEHLRQAQQLMAQALRRKAGGNVADLAGRAEQIASAQRDIAAKMKQLYGENSNDRLRRYARMGDQAGDDPNAMQEMNDPNQRFRRRYGMGMFYPRSYRQATGTEKALADDKEKLAKEIGTLQRQVQQQAQSLSGARPDASAKMLRALSDAEGKELALRLQKNAEWIRQGFGDRNMSGEDSVTNGLQQFGRALRDVEVAINAPDAPGEANLPGRDSTSGTRTPANEQAAAQYRDAVAGYFKKLSQAK